MVAGVEKIKIFLCGDVMTGRGIDQILSHPVNPQIYESYLTDARDYVRLAESINGQIPYPVDDNYLWGDALKEWQRRQPQLKLINLETSVTSNDTPWPQKGINYRMHPENLTVLTAATINVCTLANNHILDWNLTGLRETLSTLQKNHLAYAGAGENIVEAQTPAIFSISAFRRILVFSMGLRSSGIPSKWQATQNRPGVWLLDGLNSDSFKQVQDNIASYKKPGDLCILSIHWGGNWGYDIPDTHQLFAHQLVDEAGVNLIHGHSSHHPIGLELYKGCPIFYGCGDFLNDYEGIEGYEEFKSHLSLMYFLEFDAQSLAFKRLEIVPLSIKNFQLHSAHFEDCQWLAQTLKQKSPHSAIEFLLNDQGSLILELDTVT